MNRGRGPSLAFAAAIFSHYNRRKRAVYASCAWPLVCKRNLHRTEYLPTKEGERLATTHQHAHAEQRAPSPIQS